MHNHWSTALSVVISPAVEQVAQWELHLHVAWCILYHTVVVDCWFLVFVACPHCRSSCIAMVVVSKIRRRRWFSRVRPLRRIALSALHKSDLSNSDLEKELEWLHWHFCLLIDIHFQMLTVWSSSVDVDQIVSPLCCQLVWYGSDFDPTKWQKPNREDAIFWNWEQTNPDLSGCVKFQWISALKPANSRYLSPKYVIMEMVNTGLNKAKFLSFFYAFGQIWSNQE